MVYLLHPSAKISSQKPLNTRCSSVLPRRDVVSITKQIRKICKNNVFVVVDDVNKYTGGYGMLK